MNKINWISVESSIPPDKELRIKDEFGNEAIGIPTWYPFKMIPQPPYTRYSSKVESCEPYWDGGWIIEAGKDLLSRIKGEITHYAE